MSVSQTKKSLSRRVQIFECRLCGNIIPFSEGVERHKQVCRVLDNSGRPGINLDQVAIINFPCPAVTVKRLHLSSQQSQTWSSSNREGNDVTSSKDAVRHLTPRKASLRALEVMHQDVSDESDGDFEEDEGDSELTNSDDGTSDTDDDTTKGSRKRKRILTTSAEGTFTCPLKGCGNSFSRMRKVRYHFVIHVENNPYACTWKGCHANLTPMNYASHMRRHYRKGGKKTESINVKVPKFNIDEIFSSDPVFLRVCEKNPGFKELFFHTGGGIGRKKGQVNNKYTCPLSFCGSKLYNLASLRKHFLLHLENNPYVCPLPECTSKFGSLCHLMRHLHGHMGKTRLQCPKCKETYCNKDKLRKHVCGDRSIPFMSKGNKSSDEINKYLRSHFAKLKSKGVIDESSQVSNYDKDEHGLIVLKREDIKTSSLFKCDPVFQQVSKENPLFRDQILLKHRRKHGPLQEEKSKKESKERSNETYKCGRCARTFPAKKSLTNHHSQAHMPRPYSCSTCFQSFTKRCNLTTHIIKFHESTDNDKYMKKSENGKWTCTICEAGFTRHYTLRNHLSAAHNVTIPDTKRQSQTNSTHEVQNSSCHSKQYALAAEKQNRSDFDTDSNSNQATQFGVVKSEDNGELIEPAPIISIKSEPAVQLTMVSETDTKAHIAIKAEFN